jgi:ferredoxin/flavodoxin---NADP+ reductase
VTTVDVADLRRTHYNATLSEVQPLHDELRILRVRPDTPVPAFAAGQWLLLGLGSWEPAVPGAPIEAVAAPQDAALVRRPLSISAPILAPDGSRLVAAGEEEAYEFYTTLPSEAPSAFAVRLFALAPGARLWAASAPQGRYTLDRVQPGDDVLFLATGTGEAPHNRMIWELLRRGHRGRIASVITTRCRADQGYRAVHERVMQLFPNYRYTAVATREPGEKGARLQELLHRGELAARAGFALDPARVHVFVCGNPAMVGAPRVQAGGQSVYPQPPGMVELLEHECGFSADAETGNIHFERY